MTLGVAVGGALLIAACAQLRVPMWPVPMTMQPFAVLLIAGACSRAAALGAVLSYLGAAAIGLPVLASGAAGLGGPTTGYLLGYIAVAAVLPAFDRRSVIGLLASLFAGLALVYACGVAWLSGFWLHDLTAAVRAGVLPFLPGDLVKVALAFGCLQLMRQRAG